MWQSSQLSTITLYCCCRFYCTLVAVFTASLLPFFRYLFLPISLYLSFPITRIHEDVHVAVPDVRAHPVGHDAAQTVEALAHVHRLVVQPVLHRPVQTKHCSPILSPAGAPRSCFPGCAWRNRRTCGFPPSESSPDPVATSDVCLLTLGMERQEPPRAPSGRTPLEPKTVHPLHGICVSICSTDAWLFRDLPDSPVG